MENLRTYIQEEICNLAFKKVGFSESLLQSKLIDSITFVELIVNLEEKIGKQIPQHLINEANFDTIDKIVETLTNL
jgi:acyl carrier protein